MRPSPWTDLKDAVAYVWTKPHLMAAMCLAFLVNLSAFPLSGGLLPYVAREVYEVDRTGLGYLVASFAFGALLGSIGLSRLAAHIQAARMMIVFAVIWYGLLLVFAWTTEFLHGCLVLGVAGFAQSLSLVPLAVMLLRGSGAHFRGRVMGLRMLAVYGLPIGLLVAGPLIAWQGFHVTATIYAGVGLLFTILIGLRWRGFLWPADAVGNAR